MANDTTTNLNSHGISLYIPEDIVSIERKNIFLKNLLLTQAGYYYRAKNHYVSRDGINEYVMLYCEDGAGFVETNNTRHAILPGYLAICDINKVHAYGADQLTPWTIHWVHFIGDGVPEIMGRLELSNISPVIRIGINPHCISIMNEIYSTLAKGYNFQSIMLISTYLQEFLCHCMKVKAESQLSSSSIHHFEDIIIFMLSKLRSTCTLSEMADYCSLSKYHFSRSFKEITGYPPIEYFNRLKIQKGCELLATSNMDISEISDYLSFNTPFYFSEVFKRITGISPREYRKRQPNIDKIN